MTREQKCEAIIRKMVEMANDSTPVTIDSDMGGWSATIRAGDGHTHVGQEGDGDADFDVLVNNLHHALCGGEGSSLSWVEGPR